MDSTRFDLRTSLTPAECVSRITAATDIVSLVPLSLSGMFGSKPVIGRVTESSLRLRKRIKYRNSFQSFLTATLRRDNGGTIISGRVAMHPFVRVFMFIWFGGGILIGGTIFVIAIGSMVFGSGRQPEGAWLGIVMPPVLLAFGYGLVRFGRYLARHEATFLTDFLIETLEAYKAHEVPTSRVE